MKFVNAIAALAIVSATAGAQDASKQVLSAKEQAQVLTLLKATPAVRGALASAKHWAGASKCDALLIEESTATSFKAYATCSKVGDPKEEAKVGVGLGASGQIHVSGTIYSGEKKDSPITIQIDNIEFAYAG